jgi:dTDP-4-dehydrorhamnose reductase
MKKILLTGASGFLGWNLCHKLANDFSITGIYYRQHFDFDKISWYKLNLLDSNKLKECLKEKKPDAVIHCAALSNTNFCEENPALSHHVNVYATIELAEFCRTNNIPLVFTSTDLVFNGNNAPYSETDLPRPICVYGNQKLQAEEFLLNETENAMICRLPLLFGQGAAYCKNFMRDWMDLLGKGEELKAFKDEFRTPLSVEWAANGIKKALYFLMDNGADSKCRLIHLGGPESVSRFDLALKIAACFELDEKLISAVSRLSVPMPAPRPENVSLDSNLAQEILGFVPPTLDELLASTKLNWDYV